MKFVKKSYTGVTEILKTRNFEAIAVTVNDEGIVANEDGLKIVPAGTIVGGKTKSTLENDNEPIQEKNTQSVDATSAEGVLLYDVDVTYGPKHGSMVIRGNIDINKIPSAPAAEAKTALAKRIIFMK